MIGAATDQPIKARRATQKPPLSPHAFFPFNPSTASCYAAVREVAFHWLRESTARSPTLVRRVHRFLMRQERYPMSMPAGYRGATESRTSRRVKAFLRRNGLKVESIRSHRFADDKCSHRFRVLLPGGRQGNYHPDFCVSSRFWIEVKGGVGYNIDTLYRIAGAARQACNRYVVVCDRAFAKAWERWMKVIPACSRAHARLLVFPEQQEDLLRFLRRN